MTKTFITAGAGSGKTYRITTDVAKMVKGKGNEVDKLKPDQVIMTTFTKAAAQELREKAKNELVKLGLHYVFCAFFFGTVLDVLFFLFSFDISMLKHIAQITITATISLASIMNFGKMIFVRCLISSSGMTSQMINLTRVLG